jgi:hypothetical protein
MSEPRAYQIDRSRIIFEQFEDETVLVNTETGYYYSLSNTGSEILHLIEDGCPAEELAAILFGEPANSEPKWILVEKFIEQLAAENIVIARTANRNGDRRGRIAREPDAAIFGPGVDFIPPVLERFDDVRDLLLIDPIHQVDQDFGWPKAMVDENKGE